MEIQERSVKEMDRREVKKFYGGSLQDSRNFC